MIDITKWSAQSRDIAKVMAIQKAKKAEARKAKLAAMGWSLEPEPTLEHVYARERGHNAGEEVRESVPSRVGWDAGFSRLQRYNPDSYAGETRQVVKLALAWNAWADRRGLPTETGANGYESFQLWCVNRGLTNIPASWYAKYGVTPPPGLVG